MSHFLHGGCIVRGWLVGFGCALWIGAGTLATVLWLVYPVDAFIGHLCVCKYSW